MSSHNTPLTCKEIKRILTNLGFTPLPRTGTSHEKWINHDRSHSVIVDCPKEPFAHTLISLMAKQAGVSKKEFYTALGMPIKKKKQMEKHSKERDTKIETADID